MAANLFGTRFAERGNGKRAWHGLGSRLEGLDGKATTALMASGNDFPVFTVPLTFEIDGIQYVSDDVAIVRPPLKDSGAQETLHVQLGTAKRGYTPITNYEVARLLDPLTDKWPTETVGSLGRGEMFFITLNAGKSEIAGDEMESYFFVWNDHSGDGALKIMFTPVRVVCNNTCILGEREATVSTQVIHTSRVYEEAEFAIELTGKLQQAKSAGLEALAHFPQIKVSYDQLRRVLTATYPLAEPSRKAALFQDAQDGKVSLPDAKIAELAGAALAEERKRERAAELKLAVWQRLQEFNEARPLFANTGWAVYQAITEVESWRNGGNDKQLAASVLRGQRAATMTRAYDSIASL